MRDFSHFLGRHDRFDILDLKSFFLYFQPLDWACTHIKKEVHLPDAMLRTPFSQRASNNLSFTEKIKGNRIDERQSLVHELR